MMQSEDQLERFVEQIASAQPALRGYILAMVRRSGAVDDVLQETNLALWRKRTDYDADRPFKPWAVAIAHYQVLAYFKRQRVRGAAVLDESVLVDISDEAARLAEQMDERLAALRRCLGNLPTNQRRIVEMRYGAARAVQQIADELRQSENAVSGVLHRARRALGRCIEHALAQGGEP